MKEDVVNGMETVTSAFGPKETMDRLEAAVRSKGMTVFVRIRRNSHWHHSIE